MADASRLRRVAPATSPRRTSVWAAVLLPCLVAAVYGRVHDYGFVEFDDPGYVSENPWVRGGLTAAGVRWAFTTAHMWNWHPLTWLSHMLDVQLFGLDSGAHHLVNVAFHLANTLLLWALLLRLTRAPGPSLTVAALFAVHPLHVESVAWISERKDVLSAFFFLLTLWAYAAWVARGAWRWYAAALGCFALGLMAKPMLVTVPFVLLLLDVWPLERWSPPLPCAAGEGKGGGSFAGAAGTTGGRERRRRIGGARAQTPAAAAPAATRLLALVAEKAPFFALSAAASVATYVAQNTQGAMDHSGALPFGLRAANALVSYARYLILTAWPADLAVFYPYDLHLPAWQVVGAALALGLASAAVLGAARRHPYAAVGWLLYLGMLVPVIGLVQVGSQAFADRYTYLPLIGIFILLAWGGQSLVGARSVPAPLAAATAAAVVGACAAAAWAQVGLWSDGATLLAHAARVTRGNYLAHNNLGAALEAQGKIDEAIEHYRAALRIKPDYDHARANLAHALLAGYERAVAANPEDAQAHYDLATVLRDGGRGEEAIRHYTHAVRLEPDHVQARTDLGGALVDAGRLEEAADQYRRALRAAPDDARTRFNLGSALARSGHWPEAVAEYRRVIALTPADAEAWGNLAMAHAALGQATQATAAQRKAVELARAERNWALVKTLEDWLRSYRASRQEAGGNG
jgi:tetratricopeptide (TPR) repeat protein